MYGAAIGFNAPAIHSLMQGNATDLYGNKIELTFQQASWMCKLNNHNEKNVVTLFNPSYYTQFHDIICFSFSWYP